MEKTVDAARGRWREILPKLGVDKKFLAGRQMPCPACGGRDRFRFTDRAKDGDYFCNQCGAGKGVSLLMKANGWSWKTAVGEIDKVIGNKPYRPEPLDRAHAAARAFFDAQPDRQELRSKARLSILLDENISFEAAMKLLEVLPPKVA